MITYRQFDSLPIEYKEQVRELLNKTNFEFVPPLSARTDPTQNYLKGKDISPTHTPANYFDKLQHQSFILAFKESCIIGFLAYIYNYELDIDDWIKRRIITCTYVTTVIVDNDYRNQKIMTYMYKRLFDELPKINVVVRTWSKNQYHIQYLEHNGFEIIKRIKNDRGDGIDTIYFGKIYKGESYAMR